ncbi:MAG: hypothetical protein AAB439_00435 [Patescibacteria group bacterium]
MGYEFIGEFFEDGLDEIKKVLFSGALLDPQTFSDFEVSENQNIGEPPARAEWAPRTGGGPGAGEVDADTPFSKATTDPTEVVTPSEETPEDQDTLHKPGRTSSI